MDIVTLILTIAIQIGVPPYFALSIAYAEHWNGSVEFTVINPYATGHNPNGSKDYGVMQLNSEYFGHINVWCAETNIRTGIQHIKWLSERQPCNTWWLVAVAYNCGLNRTIDRVKWPDGPPVQSLSYADKVMKIWQELDPYNVQTLIRK